MSKGLLPRDRDQMFMSCMGVLIGVITEIIVIIIIVTKTYNLYAII